MRRIELLAPAKDFDTARAAILCGADAVYIGAAQFSARQAAGNSIETIREVVELAHRYYVRVYAALNTLLTDDELPVAEALIHQLYDIGIDGLIIQDTGLLELDLPPIPLIASTQMNNDTPEKVQFLESVGFSRVILARELSIEQIRAIRAATNVELEFFVHGALCVGTSGQCYMSYALGGQKTHGVPSCRSRSMLGTDNPSGERERPDKGGRSGNRGQCAQPCRRLYTLKDAAGKVLVKDRYLLSLKDLNLSAHLETLLDAGVTSFKIEGRLKDAAYVANIVGFYRQQLDALLAKRGLQKSSSGRSLLHFEPNPHKTFNRGFTTYGLANPSEPMGSMDTPKSMGEFVGTVKTVQKNWFELDGQAQLHNGDGICFFDAQRNLAGTVVNRVEGPRIYPQKIEELSAGVEIWRNYDHAFYKQLEKPAERKIAITMTLRETADGAALVGVDEDGSEAVFELTVEKQPAQKPEQARQTAITQLSKLGNTPFTCDQVTIDTANIYFFPVSVLNTLKRGLVEAMLEIRQKNRPKNSGSVIKNETPYPEKRLSFTGNVLNEKARTFYRRHGVEHMDPAAETGRSLHGERLMTTRYCLRSQLGLCDGGPAEPLILHDEDGRQFELRFRCGDCGMEIWWRK
jgi:putative protease